MAGIAPGKSVEYHVLKHGEMFGPFAEEDLRAGVADGRFELRDFVQVEGQVVWQPMGRILEASEEEWKGAVAPDWMCILKWAWVRLRYNLDEQGALAGVTCLVLGTLSLALSSWPFVFWLPWFGAAAVAAFALFRRKREGAGGLILLAIIAVPALFHFFGPKPVVQKTERLVQVPVVSSETKAPAPDPKMASVTATAPPPVAPAKVPERIAVVQPPPALSTPPPATPAPVPSPSTAAIASVKPHYGPAPAEVATPAATPAPAGSLVSAAGKLAGTVVPFLAERVSIPSLPGLPGAAPAAVANAVKDPKEAEAEAAAAAKAAEDNLLQSHHDAFVIVKGSNGSGSGFACREGDKTWLFSNIHVVSEIRQPTLTRLDGVTLSASGAEVAAGPDIARMVLTKPPEHPLEMITDFEMNVRIGDEVVVLGNSGGGGVVTSLKGKVVGIGPDRIEVSSEFIPGNSGSPIVHLKTGKVIGIATYLTRRYEQFGSNGGNGSVVVRRFGYRIDKVPGWELVNWAELCAEADQLEAISKLTGDIFDFLDAVRNKKEPTFATDTLRRPAQDWANKMRTRNMSDADRLSATQGFLNALRFMVKGDVAGAEVRFRYTYFRNRLKDEEKVRDRLYQAFDSEVAKISTPLSRHSFR